MTVIIIPEGLREKLGPEGARGVVQLVNQASQRTRDDVLTLAVERFERRLAEAKADLIKWMFVFSAGQAFLTAALFGTLLAILKL